MKTLPTLTILSALALAPAAFADDYTVFKVCQDQRVIHTSDGADAGHIEYVVVDPVDHQIISTVVTGGVVGEKFVAVPYDSMRFGTDREITLNEITREKFVSAPVIERTQISTSVIQPTVLERTSQHFGIRFDVGSRRSEVERREGGRFISTQDRNFDARGRNDPAARDRDGREVNSPQERNGNERARVDGRANDPGAPATAEERNARDRANNTNPAKQDPAAREKANQQNRNGTNNAEEKNEGRNNPKANPDATPAGRAKATSGDTAAERNRAEAANKEQSPQERANMKNQDAKEGAKNQSRNGDADSPPAGRAKAESSEQSGAAQRNHSTNAAEKEKQPAAHHNAEKATPERSSAAEKNSEKASEKNSEKSEASPKTQSKAHKAGKSDEEK